MGKDNLPFAKCSYFGKKVTKWTSKVYLAHRWINRMLIEYWSPHPTGAYAYSYTLEH